MRLSLIIISVIFFGCHAWQHSRSFDYTELNYQDFATGINKDSNYVLVDVRTPKEYKNGHMKNAINISYFGSTFSDSIKTLTRDKTVYMYCQTQHRSPLASRKMKKLGFHKIIDLKGGFMKWENHQMPIEK